MSQDKYIQMYPVQCDGGCGRHIAWSDTPGVEVEAVLLCIHCMNNPNEVEQRLEAAQ